jgi:predicted transcriptional regulator
LQKAELCGQADSENNFEPPDAHEIRVHYFRMRNITLSADEDLIERARLIARAQRRTLNAAFREWLTQFTATPGDVQGYQALMQRLRHIDAGRHFSRDELNER